MVKQQTSAPASVPSGQSELAPPEGADRQSRFGNQFLASFLNGGAGGGDVPHRPAMERAFGRDLSHIRALMGVDEVRAFGANALAMGDRIVFADASPSAETVGHEIAHTHQTADGGAGGAAASQPGEGAEREAAEAGRAAAAGENVGELEHTPSGQVQGDWLSGGLAGAGIGAGAGALAAGPVGALIGGAVGGAIGAWVGGEETLAEFQARTFAPLTDFTPSSGLGLFDVHFAASPPQLRIVLKLGFQFTNGVPANAAPGFRAAEFAWTNEEQAAWKARYLQQASAMWSGQHDMFSTRAGWERYVVPTAVEVREDAADPHFVFSVAKYPPDADMAQSSICPSGKHHSGNVCDPNAADAAGHAANSGSADMDSNDMRPEQKLDWDNATTPVYFASGSRLDATAQAVLDGVAATLTANRSAHVELTGRASLDHRSGVDAATGAIENMDLARARSEAVRTYLIGKGVADAAIFVRNAGEARATAGNEAADRRVDLQVGTHETQNPGLHETGHMLGLDDEYAAAPADTGTPVDAAYRGMVQSQTGQLLNHANDASAMSMGSTVRLAHYSSFLEALKRITGSGDWRL